MHASVLDYISAQVRLLRLAEASILEVGSYNVNGTPRIYFKGPYVGVDMRPGPGVDRVAAADRLPFDDSSFDAVISTEMLEHDTRPWRSIAEMARVVRAGGPLILTARGYDVRGCFPIHDYPDDHWRFSCGGMTALLEDVGLEVYEVRPDPECPGVFATATKPARWKDTLPAGRRNGREGLND